MRSYPSARGRRRGRRLEAYDAAPPGGDPSMANETLDATPPVAIDAPHTPELLRRPAERAAAYQASIPDRRVGLAPGVTGDSLRAALDGPLPQTGTDDRTGISQAV